jgi:hypothetical protein
VSAQKAEIIYGPDVEDAVLAAGIADERFDPESLEAAIRQTSAAWVSAVGEDATASEKDDSPLVAPALLRPGGPSARTRLVVREPQIDAIQFWRLEADAAPPLARLIVTIHGRRCIWDRDTSEPVSGDPEVMTWFHQFWDMVGDGPAMRPWHLEARVGRDSRDYADAMGCTFTTRRETVQECRERTAAEPQSDEPGSAAPGEQSPARRFRLSCGFFEHDVYTGRGCRDYRPAHGHPVLERCSPARTPSDLNPPDEVHRPKCLAADDRQPQRPGVAQLG